MEWNLELSHIMLENCRADAEMYNYAWRQKLDVEEFSNKYLTSKLRYGFENCEYIFEGLCTIPLVEEEKGKITRVSEEQSRRFYNAWWIGYYYRFFFYCSGIRAKDFADKIPYSLMDYLASKYEFFTGPVEKECKEICGEMLKYYNGEKIWKSEKFFKENTPR